MPMNYTAAAIAFHLNGEVEGDPATILTGFAPADGARPGDLTFAENEVYFARAEASAAAAILVSSRPAKAAKVLIHVPNARVAFAQVLPLFFPEPTFAPGIHPQASVAPSAIVDPTAHVGPHCTVADRARLGPGVVLESNNFVGPDAVVGAGSHLFPNVTLYSRTVLGERVRIHAGTVIGADGFGYVLDQGVHRKVPQIGNVIIGDDVEIGANVTVDRGALGATVIGRGTKIDNLVQVGHNVVIGEHSLLVSQVGIAGSTKLGNYVTLGGQVGIAGHLRVGNHVVVSAQSGVMDDVADGERRLGSPAVADRQAKKQYIAIQQLPDLIRRVRVLENQAATQPATAER